VEPRFTPILDDVWLSAQWDACSSGTIPSPSRCSQLAKGFVGCNLVMDVANSLIQIADAGNHAANVAPGVTVGQLDSWLENPAGAREETLAAPVAGPALKFVEDTALHPGQHMNFLLVRDAVGRRLGGPAAGTLIYARATRTFAAGLPNEPGLPESCRNRLPAVRKAFEVWWDATSARLAELLVEWPALRLLARNSWTDLLSRHLFLVRHPDDQESLLGDLVRAKGRQWSLCAGERRFVVFPVNAEWFKEMGSRILSAFFDIPRSAMEFNESDMQNWVRLWRWTQEQDVGVPIPGQLPEPEAVGPRQVPPSDLEYLLDWWDLVDKFWNSRKEGRPYAEDIFAWVRSSSSTPFGDREESTRSYWK
jgi:hypothetical protein